MFGIDEYFDVVKDADGVYHMYVYKEEVAKLVKDFDDTWTIYINNNESEWNDTPMSDNEALKWFYEYMYEDFRSEIDYLESCIEMLREWEDQHD